MGPRRGPTKRAEWAQEILHAMLKRGSEEHSVPKEKRATTPKTDLGETRFGGLGRLFGAPLAFSLFLVALSGLLVLLVCLLPCLRVCWVLPGSGSCLFALFSVYGRRKTFRYPLLRVFITYYFFTNKNEVYAVLMELDETVRNCTFHLKVPSSSLSVVSSPLTRLSCVRLCTPSFPQRRHHACSSCDDCSE